MDVRSHEVPDRGALSPNRMQGVTRYPIEVHKVLIGWREVRPNQVDGVTTLSHNQVEGVTRLSPNQVEGVTRLSANQVEGVTR